VRWACAEGNTGPPSAVIGLMVSHALRSPKLVPLAGTKNHEVPPLLNGGAQYPLTVIESGLLVTPPDDAVTVIVPSAPVVPVGLTTPAETVAI
jgi:hypothetical protein